MKWLKFTERECDLFTAYCIMVGYLKNYQKNIGKNLENFLLVCQCGMVNSWRLEDEYKAFLNYLKTKKLGEFEKILDRLDVQNEKMKKFLSYKTLDNFNDNQLVRIFINFVDVYQNYFALFTLPKYFGMVLDESKLPNKLKAKINKTRGVADYEKIQKVFLPLFFSTIEKRKNIKSSLLFYALPEEIVRFLRSGQGIKNDILKNRKKTVLFLTLKRKTKILTGKKANRFLGNLKSKNIESNFIKGSIANKGVVTGRVKVVKKESDLGNLRNKIVVTPMTAIKFVPALRGIKAIVTDEGGIACHAAIISRELNIPCIIGTKVATTIFKDGDLVEVDANKGIVRRLKLNKKIIF
ncbi:MAG: PEP-utilizing enzyme [Patescibacteria group bacterium]|nr:PEP-utilizing enzyme [Patescibacteria group bacterium]